MDSSFTLRRSFIGGLLVWVLAWFVSACTTTATPPMPSPELPDKEAWSAAFDSEVVIDLEWWRAFGDEQLNTLVERATADNAEIALMVARVGVAEANIGQARAALLPIFNVGGRTDTTKFFSNPDLPSATKYGVGGDMAWELDVWGKTRERVAAGEASFAASEAEYRAAYLSIVSAVASAYFQIRMADEQIAQQTRALERNEQILGIYERMHAQGLLARTRIEQQQAESHALRSSLLELKRGRALTENGLATLVGEAAGEFRLPAQVGAAAKPPEIPLGLPSELLNRRPDVVAAHFRLLESVKMTGSARKAQLPRIGLTGLGGSASMGLGGLLSSWSGSLASVLQFPVFDPNVRANIRVSEAQIKVAEQEYRVAVMRAFEDVENVLVNIHSRTAQQEELRARLESLQQVSAQQHKQLSLGLVSQLELLESERSLLSAELDLRGNRWQLLTDSVALFKALGGGWQAQEFGAY